MRQLWLALALLLVVPSLAAASTTTPGPPPPDCATVGKDYTDPTCTAQSRNGTFRFSSHLVKPGGTIKGEVLNRCVKHSTGDFSKPADQPCPIDWSPLLAIGKKVSGCALQNASCLVRVPKTAKLSKYTIVSLGITSDQGTGYSKDYFAIVK
jgi:hypothetical protein